MIPAIILFTITIVAMITSFVLFSIGERTLNEKLKHASAIVFLIGVVVGFIFMIVVIIGYFKGIIK